MLWCIKVNIYSHNEPSFFEGYFYCRKTVCITLLYILTINYLSTQVFILVIHLKLNDDIIDAH